MAVGGWVHLVDTSVKRYVGLGRATVFDAVGLSCHTKLGESLPSSREIASISAKLFNRVTFADVVGEFLYFLSHEPIEIDEFLKLEKFSNDGNLKSTFETA